MRGSKMDFTILPPGTVIFAPDDIHQVTFMFKTDEDAIVFHEFWRAFSNGEIVIEVTEVER
jgi:hypothetical protein